MTVESGPDDAHTDPAESSGPGSTADGATADPPSGQVHVRRLGVVDTLRWSWAVLRDRPELVGVALAANLPAVAAAVGVTRPSPSADVDVAAWVWPVSLVQLFGVTVAVGVAALTAADAVAFRSRPLTARVFGAARRVPALAATGLVVVVAVGTGLLPVALLDGATPPDVGLLPVVGDDVPEVGDDLLAVLSVLAVVVAGYVFHRLLLAFPACVVDATGPVASARAGWDAATGTVWKAFGVGAAAVVVAVVSTFLSGKVGPRFDVASTLTNAVLGALAVPVFGLAFAHLYLEGSRNR